MATIADILADIETQIHTIVNDPDEIVSYRVGDLTVNRKDKLEMLLAARREYQALAVSEPYEHIAHVAWDYDDFGQLERELVGDPNT